jgi:ATP-binding cassette subfamily F protein 3
MSILTGTGLAKSYGIQDVFEGIDLSIAHGEKVALVGSNGEGKTTLLHILTGLEEPTQGTVTRMRNVRIGYLPQQAEEGGSETPWELCGAVYGELKEMQARLRHLETLLADPDAGDAALERYGRLMEAFEHAGGYAYEVEMRSVLNGLGFDEVHMHRPMDQLSGGQRTRVQLARLLLEKPSILVLDEPTNHLDLEAVEWLEGYLQAWPEALIVVSHDRYFLDKVVSKIWDLAFGRLEVYHGNYSHYVAQRADRMARRLVEWKAQQEVIARTEDYIRRYKAGQLSRQAKGRQKRLDRMERLERPRQARTMHLRIESDLRSGELVLVTRDLVVGYDAPLLSVPDLELRRLHRVALIGRNGSGKTTLLKTILGQIPPLAGEAKLGASLKIGYLSQSRESLDPEHTIADEVMRAKEMELGPARDLMARFLFTGDDVFKRISTLSGGERCRVALAKLTLAEPNYLVLDEPTNQLDIASREVLEEVLQDFIGTVLFVSHDRYLINALATQVWAIEGDRMRVYKGDYQEYLAQRQKEQAAVREQAEQEKRADRQRRQEKHARAREHKETGRTLQDVEEDIATLEKEIKRIGAALVKASTEQDLDRAQALGVEYSKVESELEQRIAEWTTMGEAGG